MAERDKPFVLFSCCIPVRGARRSVICDLQRQRYRFIPNALYEILTEHRHRTIEEIKRAYDHQDDAVIDGYFDLLLEEELGFFTEHPERFPPLDLTWDAPERITNAVIEADRDSDHDYHSLLGQLDGLGCRALELRFYDAVGLGRLRSVLHLTDRRRLRSVDLLLPHAEWTSTEAIERLWKEFPRLSQVVVHGAPEAARRIDETRQRSVRWIPQPFSSAARCGWTSAADFRVNMEMFTESRTFNSCLNRKLSVDARGVIKNCPAMTQGFGHARRVRLEDVVARDELRSLWSVTKDQVEVCRDCEFRYVCTDCRVFVEGEDARSGKPARCGYDPYTATWSSPEDPPAHVEPRERVAVP